MARKLGKTAGEKAEKKRSTKQRVKDTVAEIEQSKVASSDTKKDYFAQAKDAKAELAEKAAEARVATQARNKAHAQYRNVLKEASKAGINQEALAEALTITDRDPVEFARHVKHVNEFLVIAEYPLDPGSGQYGLFENGGGTVSAKVDGAKMAGADDIEQAKEKGTVAGRKGINANPYDEGSPEFLAYEGTYRDEQNEMLANLGKGNRPEAGAAAH